jgi:glycolate oxidase FAD binding subunit
MTQSLRPETPDQVLEAVRWAVAEERSFVVAGSDSKAGFGRPVAASCRLELAALSGILQYQPEELVVTARAATPLAEIEATLEEKRQRLAFEPTDFGHLLGARAAHPDAIGGTVAGAVACNLAGPRRIKEGAARDHLLGFRAVSGRGETFKSGGQVVKNVTGFDLSKLMSGSFGTLAVVTEVTLRVVPAAEDLRTLLVLGRDEIEAIRAMTAALQSSCEVSGAAHLPPDVALLSEVDGVRRAGAAVTALRIEGPPPSVDYRGQALRALLAPFGEVGELDAADSARLWREIRDAVYFAEDPGRQIWRLAVPPADGALVAAEALFGTEGQVFFDWGGGLVWLSLPPTDDARHREVRQALTATGGHATLLRAADPVRASVPVFQPQPPALAALTRRVKDGFDPNRVLNPERMYLGV